MAVRVAVATHRGFRRLFSTDSTSTVSLLSPPPLEPSTSLFVAGLNKRTSTERLWEAFSQFGKVVHARVMTDRLSGISNGFGYVKYTSIEEAAKGIEGMDGKFLDGWIIFAEYARERQPPKQPVNHHMHESIRHEKQKNKNLLKDKRRPRTPRYKKWNK